MTTTYPLRYNRFVNKQNQIPSARSGFTLLELSIVLAMIGLLVGGVLATQSYLRTASLVNTINEAKSFMVAAQEFQKIYSALPGDMSNATDNWGNGGGCPNTITSGTCNGDGNGQIFNAPEIFLAFQHLQLAGLVKGTYTGLTGGQSIVNAGSSTTTDAVPGQNVPNLSTANVSMYFMTLGNSGYSSGHSNYFDGNYGPYFVTVGSIYARGYLPDYGYMSGPEAFEIDSKFDNGVPSTGWIRGRNPNFSSCTTSATAYSTTIPGPGSMPCTMYLVPQ